MENKDFKIENNVLLKYYGNDSHVVIPNGVTEIGYGVFYRNDTLNRVDIPNTVTRIGNDAFYDCVSLENVNIPNSVTEIDNGAFAFCEKLESINIPNSVTEIGGTAFYACNNVKEISISTNTIEKIGCGAFSTGICQTKYKRNSDGKLRAFKAFRVYPQYNDMWVDEGTKFEMCKQYHVNGKIEIYGNGFKAYCNPLDVFHSYHFKDGDLKTIAFAEVELSGKIAFADTNTLVRASDIKIIRELSLQELFDIFNDTVRKRMYEDIHNHVIESYKTFDNEYDDTKYDRSLVEHFLDTFDVNELRRFNDEIDEVIRKDKVLLENIINALKETKMYDLTPNLFFYFYMLKNHQTTFIEMWSESFDKLKDCIKLFNMSDDILYGY